MRFKKVEEIKEWCKEHEQNLRDCGFYMLGVVVGVGAPIVADKIVLNKHARLEMDACEDRFYIRTQKQQRFGKGYTNGDGVMFNMDQLDSVAKDFEDFFEGVRNRKS